MASEGEKYTDPLISTTIAGRYELLSIIGIGGWSTVYRANDLNLKRQVAVKMLHPHLCIDATKVTRFRREAEATAAIAHPNLAAIYDSGLIGETRPYFVMEIVEGTPLNERFKRESKLTPEACVALFEQILNAVGAIHQHGLLHRDLKPGNVLVSENGLAKVVDFGMAKWILQDNPLTKTDEALGTPAYMSPEQCAGKPIDARSDLYSIGCMLYEALSGAKPFQTDNMLEFIRMHASSKPPRLIDAKIPSALKHTVMKALEKNPQDRPSTAEEFTTELVEAIRPVPAHRRLQKFLRLEHVPKSKKRRIVIVSSCTIALVLLASMPIALMLKQRTLKFPASHSCGSIYLMHRDNNGTMSGKTFYGYARGAVEVPNESFVLLSELPQTQAADLSFLNSLNGKDLQSLDLFNQELNEQSIACINHMSQLKILSLSHAKIADKALMLLTLPKLEGLDLSTTGISSRSVEQIAGRLPALHWISLRGCKNLDDAATPPLVEIKTIGCIMLDDVPGVNDGGMPPLRTAAKLAFITLNHDRISDQGVNVLSQITKLTRLDLAGTSITDIGVKYLTSLSRLHHLDLSETAISDSCINDLAQFKRLRELFVSSTKITRLGAKRLRQLLPECEITGDN
ncbi:MAG TPA: protein kinase [Planktothrix sp.]